MKGYSKYVMLLFFSYLTGCNSLHNFNESQTDLLVETLWVLDSIEHSVLIPTQQPISITFNTKKKRFWGYAGCNNFSGTYAIKNNKITFGPTRSTRMYCRDISLQEDNLLTILSGTKIVNVTANSLKIYHDNTKLLATFIR